MNKVRTLTDRLYKGESLTEREYVCLLGEHTQEDEEYLFALAREVGHRYYGRDIYIRGLIEISNYCRNNCYYCGIRKDNHQVSRYRLTQEDILGCARQGYELGFRTFVLQGGEDPWFTEERLVDIIKEIKREYPDCAITLSLGEKTREAYQRLYDAGADRYLLRHETADSAHYGKLHPSSMSLEKRKNCLYTLKEIGYQTGAGGMIGSPGQTLENLAEDLKFMEDLKPDMVGIGPFLPHNQTPFREEEKGSLKMTLFMLGVIRLMLPQVLLPATTALATLDPKGRALGVLAGANVVMPNLSPLGVREKYMLYDNKISTGTEGAEAVSELRKEMAGMGYQVVTARGDCCHIANEKRG